MSYSKPLYYQDEFWNAVSHGIGLLLALIGGYFIFYNAIGRVPDHELNALAIYIAGAAFVYASSTAYHAAPPGTLKDRLQTIDHISIFFMIAGSHTPIILKYFNNTDGTVFLGIMWSMVFVGTIFKLITSANRFETLSVAMYIMMGLMSLYFLPDLLRVVETEVLWLILAGGMSYLIGVIFYVWRSLPFHHPIWHTFVIAGSVLHFMAIYDIHL